MSQRTDIYVDNEKNLAQSALRFICIEVRNVSGILNRVVSLMRRKRFNLEEVSVSFDTDNMAYMIFAIDSEAHDVNHIIEQIKKLHDVFDAYDTTDQYEKIYNIIDVQIRDEIELQKFPIQPVKIVTKDNKIYAIFIVSLAETNSVIRFLTESKYKFVRRVLGLI